MKRGPKPRLPGVDVMLDPELAQALEDAAREMSTDSTRLLRQLVASFLHLRATS